jgi:hypothetical protein
LSETDFWQVPTKGRILPTFIIILITIGLGYLIPNPEHSPSFFSWLFYGAYEVIGTIVMLGCLGYIFLTISDNRRVNKQEKIARIHNIQEEDRVAKNHKALEEKRQNWNARSVYLKRQKNEVRTLLNEAYSINILPNPYRNLASVYYIYDYMSSSQAGLEETLLHEHLENGIQRILDKLNTIIYQNEYRILQNQRIEASNQQLVSRATKMVNSLAQIKDNTELAAQYARLSAFYSGATAYFAYAGYLNS